MSGLSAGICRAQNATGRIDSLVRTLDARDELAGNVLVTEAGSVVYRHSSGYADLAAHRLNN